MYKAIVVGTNGSESAAKAVAHAAALAHAHNASLHIVTSIPPRTFPTGGTVAGVVVDSGPEVETILNEAAAAIHQEGMSIHTHGLHLDPAWAIVDVARRAEADLVVVGDKGMQGARRYVLGSVPNSVAHNAPCTVLIVKTT